MASVSFHHGVRIFQEGEEPGPFSRTSAEGSDPIDPPLEDDFMDFSRAAQSGLLALLEDI
jgi:hypothetical protein